MEVNSSKSKARRLTLKGVLPRGYNLLPNATLVELLACLPRWTWKATPLVGDIRKRRDVSRRDSCGAQAGGELVSLTIAQHEALLCITMATHVRSCHGRVHHHR
jgi:hypothetical protein